MKSRFLIMGLGTIAIMACATLSACSASSVNGFESIKNVMSADNDLRSLTQNLDEAKLVYADNHEFFTIADREQIDEGLVKIEAAVSNFYEFKQSESIKKFTSSADFLANYRQARQGYLSIRQVLVRRKGDLNPRNLIAFQRFDENAQRVDTWAYKLAANESSSQRIKTVTELITNGATLIAATAKLIAVTSKA